MKEGEHNMASYIVVITPEVGDAAAAKAQATIRVETGAPAPRITEMTVRSTAPSGLSAGALPSIDLDAVIRALSSGIEATAPPERTPTRKPAGKSTRAGKGARSKRTATPSTPANAESGERAYRRMPPVDELRGVHERVGTINAVAEHYEVPRHTAQGWLRRLRKLTG
jgi:hypothetical protein